MPKLILFASALANVKTAFSNRLSEIVSTVVEADLTVDIPGATLALLSHNQQFCWLRLMWNCRFWKELLILL